MKARNILLLFCQLALNSYAQDDSLYNPLSKELSNKTVRVLYFVASPIKNNDLATIKSLKRLKTLNITECWDITELPQGLNKLRYLEHISFFWNGGGNNNINWDNEFKKIYKCHKLRFLILGPYNEFKTLPKGIKKLKNLELLNLSMTDLIALPDDINQLQNLRELNLATVRMKKLPCTLLDLKNLKKLILSDGEISKNDEVLKKLMFNNPEIEVVW